MDDAPATDELGLEELGAPPRSDYPRLGASSLTYRGLPRDGWKDGYHYLLTMPVWAFIALMASAYLAINTLFGLLYLLDSAGLSGARPGSFQDAFFFSVESFDCLVSPVEVLGLGRLASTPAGDAPAAFCELCFSLTTRTDRSARPSGL